MKQTAVKTAVSITVHTHLPVNYNAPDEPKNQFVVSINDVSRSNVYQINLDGDQKETNFYLVKTKVKTQRLEDLKGLKR